jgi:hypothetical protein
MIHEYALEPALISNWPNFRYFTEKFGIPQGRLISRYPKSWKKLVYQSLGNCGDVERKKIEEGLKGLDDRILRRPNSPWNPELTWLPNAEIEHVRKPFHAILALANPNGHAFVLQGAEVDDNNLLWRVERTKVVPREAAQMAQAIAPLLRVSDVIRFVDPHFNPALGRFRRAFQALMAAVFEFRDCGAPTRIEVHLSTAMDSTHEYFEGICNTHLPQLIRAGIEVRLFRWQQKAGGEELHNRYMLTDLGGIRFGAGLDEGAPGETDELEILDDNAYRLRFTQYHPAGTTFELADQVVVVGTRP